MLETLGPSPTNTKRQWSFGFFSKVANTVKILWPQKEFSVFWFFFVGEESKDGNTVRRKVTVRKVIVSTEAKSVRCFMTCVTSRSWLAHPRTFFLCSLLDDDMCHSCHDDTLAGGFSRASQQLAVTRGWVETVCEVKHDRKRMTDREVFYLSLWLINTNIDGAVSSQHLGKYS